MYQLRPCTHYNEAYVWGVTRVTSGSGIEEKNYLVQVRQG